jgi:hypothetical protein
VGLRALPIGVAQAGAWSYAFVYEILQRHFPDVPERAHPIGQGEARCEPVERRASPDAIYPGDHSSLMVVGPLAAGSPKFGVPSAFQRNCCTRV